MSKSTATELPFWKRPSTVLVTLLRLMLILLPHLIDLESVFPSGWLYSSSLTFILVKPDATLSHVREARAIQKLGNGRFGDAYSAHPRIRIPPLLLAALSPLLDQRSPELILSLILLVVDLLIASMLEAIGRQILLDPITNSERDQEEEEQSKLPEPIRPPYAHIFPITNSPSDTTPSLFTMESLPLLAGQFYYFSPITAVSGGLYHCFQNLSGFCLLSSLYEGIHVKGSIFMSAFYLSLATYLELYYVVFLVPLCLLQSSSSSRQNLFLLMATFLVWFACLQGLSLSLVGSPTKFWKVFRAVYGCGWRTVSPSLSVQWYLAMQMFSRFRDYFGALLTGLSYILVPPLAIRLYRFPWVLVAAFSLTWSIFRPVETLFDMNLSLCFFLYSPRSLARMGPISFISLCSFCVPVILNVVDHWMWLEPNTGNANYIYFQCLAYNVFLGIILGQFCSASLQRDKALRLAAKERQMEMS